MYELVIVGGGAAGLTAAIYAARAGLHYVLLEQDGYGGGQIQTTDRVDNYPGFYGVDGVELAEKLVEHCQALNVPVLYRTVEHIRKEDGIFLVQADGEEIQTKSVIYAAGTRHKALEVPGEQKLAGLGVSFCATCDGAFFEGKTVAVVGSGDTAVSEAIYLGKICKTVHLLFRKDRLKAAQALQDRLLACDHIILHPETRVEGISGTEQVEGLQLSTPEGECTLPCDGVFVAIGSVPATEILDNLGICDENGYIVAGETGETPLPGFFAAGDIRTKQLRQFLTAAADGANAVDAAGRYLATISKGSPQS